MQSSSSKTKQFSFLLLITLGVMTAFGPLTIDMYVPSLPKVQGDFGSTTSEIQLTLSFTMSCTWSIYLRTFIRCLWS